MATIQAAAKSVKYRERAVEDNVALQADLDYRRSRGLGRGIVNRM